MNSLRVCITDVTDPWFNLATEDWLFREADPDGHILYLWRNAPTVVIGRYQNPWAECDLRAMEAEGVLLSRRQSGGGAVFHDLGNTNFTFISGRRDYSKERNSEIIIAALRTFGITAEASGRNDIVVDGKKVSGSAFKLSAHKAFHHGTLLINADLTQLLRYLTPDKQKLAAKGIASVSSRVANLADYEPSLNHEGLIEAVTNSFFSCYQDSCPVEHLDHSTLYDIPHLRQYYDFMRDWEWRFGRTPSFTHQLSRRFDWGSMELLIKADKGIISGVTIHSDTLYPELVELLESLLTGIPYAHTSAAECRNRIPGELPFPREVIDEALEWIISEL